MKALLFCGLILARPAAAYADSSDSGNLTVGQQAVVSGTMTVQGNAFSVGGSTFVVAGGSVTLGGPLNVAASGIKWADGSTSTTAAAGGLGNAILAATQTWSGANTFLSTTSVSGPSNLITLVSSGVFVGTTSVDIPYFTDNQDYYIVIVGSQTTAGEHRLRINNDTGNNYDWTGAWNDASNAANSLTSYSDSRTTPSYIRLTRDNPADGTRFQHRIEISSYLGYTTIQGRSTYKWGGANTSEYSFWEGHYSAQAISFVRIYPSAGKITGRYHVYRGVL